MAATGGSRTFIAVLALLLAAWLVGALDDDASDTADTADTADRSARDAPDADRVQSAPDEPGGVGARSDRPRDDEARRTPKPRPSVRTYVVVDVVDGDTVDLGNGETVRLAGIDTPELGECGYERARDALSRLALYRRASLGPSDEDRDQYGRLLRYLDVRRDGRRVDAGLTLIRRGLAVARYDSRDGYGRHPRESVYVAADAVTPDPTCRQAGGQVRGLVGPPPRPGCAPGYSPCVPPYPPDVDCGDLSGPVRVTGRDPHGLDADGDGWACES